MKISVSTLLVLTITAVSPKESYGLLMDFLMNNLFCGLVENAANGFLGSNGECDCAGDWRWFHHGPHVDANCTLDIASGFDTTLVVDVAGRSASTTACVNVALGAPVNDDVQGCAKINFRRRGLFRFLNWQSDGCEVTIDGDMCASCTVEGGLPLPQITFDCDDVAGFPDDFGGFDFS